jgi:plastocyanin
MKTIAVALLAVLALGARSSRPSGSSRPGADSTVLIQTFGFRPKELAVPVGTRVVWTNDDEVEHTVTAVTDSGTPPPFNGVLQGKGKTFSFTFDRPGTFIYQCARHTFMRGEIRVTPKGER